jgi:hypothetical protein
MERIELVLVILACSITNQFFAYPPVPFVIFVNMFRIGSWYNTDTIKHCDVKVLNTFAGVVGRVCK